MKKIKRSISILLIAMMALAMLGGCGNNSTSGNSTANGDSAKATEKTADAGEAKGTESNPFILGVSPMSGWYAWYGVKDTGIFEQNGVYVDLQFFPVYSDSLTAFYSGQVDGICIAASDAVAPVNEGVDFKVVLVNDNSYGADGIVVQDGINSIEDLKGKTVATEVGTLEHMFLLKILEENNMTVDDGQLCQYDDQRCRPGIHCGKYRCSSALGADTFHSDRCRWKLLYSTKEEPGLIRIHLRSDRKCWIQVPMRYRKSSIPGLMVLKN